MMIVTITAIMWVCLGCAAWYIKIREIRLFQFIGLRDVLMLVPAALLGPIMLWIVLRPAR